MGNSTSFTRVVDDAIRSTSPSILGDSPLRSFGSLIDSAIRSSPASTTDAEFDLILSSPGLSGPTSQQAQAQQDRVAASPGNSVNLQTLQNQTPTQDKSKSSPRGTDTKNESRIPKNDPTAHIPVAVQIFTFRELAVATKNFRSECLLGEGGSKRVYKGCLESTGQVVAVKQHDRYGPRRNQQFLTEVLMLSRLHHPNLVNLIGYCSDGDQRLIVYEFMPLGSLGEHLHDLPPDREPLDWNTRLKIAAGAAKGLEYLHENVNPPVIYRNLKPSDILLDEGYHPKLSDFALAKLGPVGDETYEFPYGYCAPEYAMTGQLSLKSDVYSFGVVLLELITGRKAIDNIRADGDRSLVAWARLLLKDRRNFTKMADPLLQGCYPKRGLYQALAVAAMCLLDNAAARPHMHDVVTTLTYLASQIYHPSAANESNKAGPSIQR